MTRLTLASTSATRRTLLQQAGLEFEVTSSSLDEAAAKSRLKGEGRTPASVARTLAELKALEASHQLAGMVIGADQTLELDGIMYDKPGSLTELRNQLLTLRGRAHQLHAAVALARDGALIDSVISTATLHVRAFSQGFLERYVDREGEAVLGCVGGYRLEGLGVQLFEAIEGDYFTVLGLPLAQLLSLLRTHGVLDP